MATVGLPQWLGRPCIPVLYVLIRNWVAQSATCSGKMPLPPTPMSSAAWSQRPVGKGPDPPSCPLPFLGS